MGDWFMGSDDEELMKPEPFSIAKSAKKNQRWHLLKAELEKEKLEKELRILREELEERKKLVEPCNHTFYFVSDIMDEWLAYDEIIGRQKLWHPQLIRENGIVEEVKNTIYYIGKEKVFPLEIYEVLFPSEGKKVYFIKNSYALNAKDIVKRFLNKINNMGNSLYSRQNCRNLVKNIFNGILKSDEKYKITRDKKYLKINKERYHLVFFRIEVLKRCNTRFERFDSYIDYTIAKFLFFCLDKKVDSNDFYRLEPDLNGKLKLIISIYPELNYEKVAEVILAPNITPDMKKALKRILSKNYENEIEEISYRYVRKIYSALE